MSRQRVHTMTIAVIALALGLAGCMPGPNPLKGSPVGDGQAAGFFLGVWHGLIGPVTFVMSLFKDGTGFYEVHNNGGWYNAGFLLGLGVVLGGGSFQGKAQLRRGGGRQADDQPGAGSSVHLGGGDPSPRPPAEKSDPSDQDPRPGSRSGSAN